MERRRRRLWSVAARRRDWASVEMDIFGVLRWGWRGG